MERIISKAIKNFFTKGNQRTLKAKKNILLSLIIKGIHIYTTLLVVPITINYINATQYGIWLTLSSILGWLSFFDIGLSNGFRNKFAEAKATGNSMLAKKYVSTTYMSIGVIFICVAIIGFIINLFLHWNIILNVPSSYNNELRKIFNILITFFCLQMILKVITSLIIADQKPALASGISTLAEVLSLIIIFILTQTTQGSLLYLAESISFIPSLVWLITSFILFNTTYKDYKPSIKDIDTKCIKNILTLGGNFFIIQISMIFLFQCTNIVLSNVKGPEYVTIYNIAYKYFSIFNMIMIIILTPFWSAFTEAYTKKDFPWMRNMYKKLQKAWIGISCILIFFLLNSSWIIKLWIGENIQIPFSVLCMMAIYILLLSRANLNLYLINGVGKVTVQMYINLFLSIISVPTLIVFLSHFGLEGGILILCITPIIQLIFCNIQIKKILNNDLKGIWNK